MIDLRKIAENIESVLLSDESILSNVTKFISSGSTLLDLALGGGWAVRRISNIIGDTATAKSLLAAEAAVNAIKQYDSVVVYDDAESTFSKERATVYGIDPEKIIYRQSDTVEEFFSTIAKLITEKDYAEPLVYILDSLDAVSSKVEMDRSFLEETYGVEKPKKISEGFRRITRMIADKDVAVIIVSQTRDKIGQLFGDRIAVSGGKALKFYSSQQIMLSQVEKLEDKNKNVFGMTMKFKVIKNKIISPYKEGQFDILFDMGVDDTASNVAFYLKYSEDKTWDGKKFRGKYAMVQYIEEHNQQKELKQIVQEMWSRVKETKSIRRKDVDIF